MSAICNKIVSLSPSALRDKKRLAQDAGLELFAAASDVFKALELRHHGDNVGSVSVYLASATTKLRNATQLLADVAELLRSEELSAEAAAWYRQLDYERLYLDGVASNQIPTGHDVWSEFVATLATTGPAGLCTAYQGRMDSAAAVLTEWQRDPTAPTADAVLVKAQTAIVSLIHYAQFVAYVNKLEPLDAQWLTAPAPAEAGVG